MCRSPSTSGLPWLLLAETNNVLNVHAHALPLKMSLSRKRKYSQSQKFLFRLNYAFIRRFDSYTFTKKSLGCILARVLLQDIAGLLLSWVCLAMIIVLLKSGISLNMYIIVKVVQLYTICWKLNIFQLLKTTRKREGNNCSAGEAFLAMCLSEIGLQGVSYEDFVIFFFEFLDCSFRVWNIKNCKKINK